MTVEARNVQVRYVPTPYGVALAIDEAAGGDAVLRVGGACTTLEIPTPDGGRSVLTWDPAEVAIDLSVAPAA